MWWRWHARCCCDMTRIGPCGRNLRHGSVCRGCVSDAAKLSAVKSCGGAAAEEIEQADQEALYEY